MDTRTVIVSIPSCIPHCRPHRADTCKTSWQNWSVARRVQTVCRPSQTVSRLLADRVQTVSRHSAVRPEMLQPSNQMVLVHCPFFSDLFAIFLNRFHCQFAPPVHHSTCRTTSVVSVIPLCSCNRSSVIPPTSCKRSPNFTHVCVLSTRGNHFKRKPEFCRRCWCWCCSFLKDASSFFFLVRMFSTSTGTGNQ